MVAIVPIYPTYGYLLYFQEYSFLLISSIFVALLVLKELRKNIVPEAVSLGGLSAASFHFLFGFRDFSSTVENKTPAAIDNIDVSFTTAMSERDERRKE